MFLPYVANYMNEDSETFILFGVKDETQTYFDFTDNYETALSFAKFLNDNDVEAVHVNEIIEDMFY